MLFFCPKLLLSVYCIHIQYLKKQLTNYLILFYALLAMKGTLNTTKYRIMHRHTLHTTNNSSGFLCLICVFYVGLSLDMCFQSGNAPSTLGCNLNPLIWTTCIKSKVNVQTVQLHLQSIVKYVIDRLFSPLSQSLNHQVFYRDSLCTSHFA